ncbi:hypothetical protein [Methylosinus sp. PW1]|uniref:hypothetical protein n=1 Tax=Methylosinus sp. PW1 TaxID=107636 RepID=UPI0005624B35|nr:hypothetical protein [Methylosinus sp. PW1]
MDIIPNLYLKWGVLRDLTEAADRNADIGKAIFDDEDNGAVAFARLLRGDRGPPASVAQKLVGQMNRAIRGWRLRHRAPAPEENLLSLAELEGPLLPFVQAVVDGLPGVDPDRLDHAHRTIVDDIAACDVVGRGAPQLVVERFAAERSFEDAIPSGGAGPIEFKAGVHKGQLAIVGVSGVPAAAYTMFTRDPAPLGRRIWEMAWNETVLWLPSPFMPELVEGRLLLLRRPQPLKPSPGRFIVTTALVWREADLATLDPRGKNPPPGALDENETMQFLTRLRRMRRAASEDGRKSQAREAATVSVSSASYLVA